MSTLVELRERLPIPHLQFTWAQAPVKLEDALGRTIPVPSEYGWEVCIRVCPLFFIFFLLNKDLSSYLDSRSDYSVPVQ
jgi:hypothetical protein